MYQAYLGTAFGIFLRPLTISRFWTEQVFASEHFVQKGRLTLEKIFDSYSAELKRLNLLYKTIFLLSISSKSFWSLLRQHPPNGMSLCPLSTFSALLILFSAS